MVWKIPVDISRLYRSSISFTEPTKSHFFFSTIELLSSSKQYLIQRRIQEIVSSHFFKIHTHTHKARNRDPKFLLPQSASFYRLKKSSNVHIYLSQSEVPTIYRTREPLSKDLLVERQKRAHEEKRIPPAHARASMSRLYIREKGSWNKWTAYLP